VVVTGSVLAPIATGKMLLATSLKYKESKGLQTPQALEGEPPTVLTASLNGEALESIGLKLTATLTSEEAVEVNTSA
jgi:hypothetical protein